MRRLFFALATLLGLISAQAVIVLPAGAVPTLNLNGKAAQNSNLIHRVHGTHCSRRYGYVRHWHGNYVHTHKKWHRHCRRRRYYKRYYYRPHYYRPYYRKPGIYLRIGRRAAGPTFS